MTLVDEGDLLATVEPVEWLARDTIAPGILAVQTYLAPSGFSTPSIWTRLVFGFTLFLLRW